MRSRDYLIGFALCFGWSPAATAQPAQVILIRHAEKPTDPDDQHLNMRGRARAAALAPYFLETEKLLKFGPPAAVYAQKPHNFNKSSLRAIETVQPLAAAVKLKILTPVERDDYRKLVDELLREPKHRGKSVLICWEHHVLVDMAQAFVKNLDVAGAPAEWKWPGSSFDRTWVIQFHGDGKATFHNYPQRMMFGDAKQ